MFPVFILMLPAYIVFDLIPMAFGFKGLINWTEERHGSYNEIIPVYVWFTAIVSFTVYLMTIPTKPN
jgi:hypothetical protein